VAPCDSVAEPSTLRTCPPPLPPLRCAARYAPAPDPLDPIRDEAIRVSSWRIDRFETADGGVLERDVGFALVSAGGRTLGSVVVFGEPGDMTLLGAIGLESLNLRLDLARKELVPAGPVPVAMVCG
jgi:hypothetical protein